jgi:hypothetical protein
MAKGNKIPEIWPLPNAKPTKPHCDVRWTKFVTGRSRVISEKEPWEFNEMWPIHINFMEKGLIR